jgi:hypothetical protein
VVLLAQLAAVVTAAALTLTVAPLAAVAAPPTPVFGSAIDDYAAYDAQDTCDTDAKPGTLALRDMLNGAYGNHTAYIGRACSEGGTSEHKEGRALDYMLNVNNASQRADAEDILGWLLATDQHGNQHANARRLGIMYLIWNHRIWSSSRASEGWRSYSGSNPHTDHIHFSLSWAGARKRTSWWSGSIIRNASIYGVLDDGRLTYTAIETASGDRTKTVVSSAALPFVPVALATLNFNTLLVTSPTGQLYRVDVITNDEHLIFNPAVHLDGGWTHDLLAYDGAGSLYGIADGTLRRYQITSAKPKAANITGNTLIDAGFTLKTLTATGPDWLLGTTSTGALRSYRIRGAGDWAGTTLLDRWGGFTHLLSPGGGIYYGRTAAGGMYHYLDRSPYDFKGSDIDYFANDPVDERGWTQKLLSAQPVAG